MVCVRAPRSKNAMPGTPHYVDKNWAKRQKLDDDWYVKGVYLQPVNQEPTPMLDEKDIFAPISSAQECACSYFPGPPSGKRERDRICSSCKDSIEGKVKGVGNADPNIWGPVVNQ